MSTQDTIVEAIHVQFPNYDGPVTAETTAKNIPGWDSVAHVQLILLLEEMTGKELDIGATMAIENIGELVRFVDKA